VVKNPFSFRVHYRDGIPVLPGAFPVIGQFPSIYFDAAEVLLRGRAKLGPLFWMDVGFGQHVAMCVSREAFDVFKSKAASNAYLREHAATLVGVSILGQEGAVHQRMRGAMNAPFTPRGLAGTGVGAMVAEQMTSAVDAWAARRVVTIHKATLEVTLSTIFRLIGVEVEELSAWSEKYRDFVHSAAALPSWIPSMRRAARARVWLDEHIQAIVKAERERPNRGTFIAELVHGRDEAGQTLTDLELVDNLRLLTLAGHETTASVMAWMTIVLAQRPDLWDGLVAEAKGAGDLPRTPQEVRGFPFAEGVFREALRLYPSVALTTRRVETPLTLCGRTLKAGTMAGIGLAALARDPEIYGSPDRFEPSRWVGRKEPITPIETAQFGGGPHFCLGYHLAWMEAVVFAVALARRMAGENLRPRLADGPAPRHYNLPLGHPSKRAKVVFAQS
jgi:cytochrome P450 monooxygenase